MSSDAPTPGASVYNALRKLSGRAAVPADPRLPGGFFAGQLRVLLPELLRGLFRTRHLVLLGEGVRVRGARNVAWGRGCRVGRGCTIDGYASSGVTLGAASRIGEYSTITCTSHVTRMGVGLSLGAGSGFGDYCHFGASGGVAIGDNVLGGSYISFHSQEHVFADRDRLIRDQGVTEKGITVGDDCWIGAKVTFLDGAQVGAHSVVAAGAVVRGEFPPHSLIAGVPARLVRDLRDG